MGTWRGVPMVAVNAADGKGRVIHLGRIFRGAFSGTLCNLSFRELADTKVSTGWPDCQKCINRVNGVR